MTTVTDLAVFLRTRWDEEKDDSGLFHELTCLIRQDAGRSQLCRCPCPVQIRERIASHRRILHDCEQRIRQEQEAGLCWPLKAILAFQSMKALALPFELHPAFDDNWYP